MLEKIIEAIAPGQQKELDSKAELIEVLEKFISDNGKTEDESIMVRVLTSQNKLNRLKEEMPELKTKRNATFSQAQKIHSDKVNADRAQVLSKELTKLDAVLSPLYAKLANEEIRMDRDNKQSFYEMLKMVKTELSRCETDILRNNRNKQDYPKMKKIL